MLIEIKPQITKSEFYPCDFHRKNPGKPYAGCTCCGSYSSRDKKPEELTEDERILSKFIKHSRSLDW